jgi:hypothetical protein
LFYCDNYLGIYTSGKSVEKKTISQLLLETNICVLHHFNGVSEELLMAILGAVNIRQEEEVTLLQRC